MRTARLLTIGALSAALILPTAVAAQSPAGAVFTATLQLKDFTKTRVVPLKAGKTDVPAGKTVNAWYVSETGAPNPTAGQAGWKNVPTDFKLSDEDGEHTVYIWARATGGVVSSRGSDTTFLDRVVPEVGDVTTVPAQAVAPDDPQDDRPITPSRSVSIAFEYSDPGENDDPQTGSGVAKYAVVNGTTPPVPGSLDWKAAPNATGPVTVAAHKLTSGNGDKTVSIFVRDRAGNVSLASSVYFKLVIAGPTVTLTAPDYTKTNKPAIKAVAKQGTTVLTGASFFRKVTTTNVQPDAPLPGAAGWVTAPTTATMLQVGDNYLWVWAKDSNGTVSSSPASKHIVWDNVAPLALLELDEGATTTDNVVDFFDLDYTDALTPVTKWVIVNGTTVPTLASAWKPMSTAFPTTWTLPYGNGSKTLTLFVQDAAGNVSAVDSDSSKSITMTLAAPVVTVVPTSDYKDGSNNWYSKDLSVAVNLNWTADPSVGKTSAQYNFTLTNVEPTTGWKVALSSVTIADLADGNQTFYVWVKDRNGQVGSASAQVYLDRTAPTLALTVNNNNTANPTFTVTPGVEAGSGIAKYALVVGTTAPIPSSNLWVTSAGSVALSVGTQTVTAFARDNVGNVSAVVAGVNSKSVTVTAP